MKVETPPEYLYRFRSLERFLDKNELENQEIYFASPSSLNDPVEGFLDLVWQGDAIVWTLFFKNYIICFEQMHTMALLSTEEEAEAELTAEKIPIYTSVENLPTKLYRDKLEEIYSKFFADENILKLISGLAKRTKPIRRDQLLFFLKTVHAKVALLVQNKYQPNPQLDELLKVVNKNDSSELLEKEEEGSMDTESMYNIGFSFIEQKRLLDILNDSSLTRSYKRTFLLFEFPEKYLKQLERLMYPEWYAACFMADVSHAAMWGHYGDAHQGVCLKFKTVVLQTDSKIGLPLNSVIGVGGRKGENKKIRGTRTVPFHKVTYDSKYPTVDFFRSISRLPLPALYKNWYTNSNGEISVCAESLKDIEEWRKNLWKAFYKSNTTKLSEWKYEDEYRLITNGLLDESLTKEDRSFKYDFKSLAGVVFGIKTPSHIKIKIMEIMNRKCKENNSYDFKFYQAAYSHSDGKIVINELPILQPRA